MSTKRPVAQLVAAHASTGARPLVCTLTLDGASSARLDAWRRRWFPSERNFLAAHLTLFHALPDDEAIVATVRDACAVEPMPIHFARLQTSATSVVVRAEAPAARRLHDGLRRAFATSFGDRITSQDRQGLAPHVTLVNKATPEVAARAADAITAEFVPWEGRAEGIALWRYEGGPWSPLAHMPFTA